MYKQIFSIILSFLLVIACAREQPDNQRIPEILYLSDGPSGNLFYLQQVEQELHVVYPDFDSLSLKLLIFADFEGDERKKSVELLKTFFLDRISYTPEIDSLFGDHLYLIGNNQQHIFYIDWEREEKKILKWISKPFSSDTWWIDIIPYSGKLVTALITESDRIELFLSYEDALYVKHVGSSVPPECIMASFSQRGDVSNLLNSKRKGFTVFDAFSNYLYLIQQHSSGYVSEPIFTSGEIHYSTITDEGNLNILIYDIASTELTFLERFADYPQLKQSPVTLCRGTNSVFFFFLRDNKFFLYNEVTLNQNKERSYQISLIYPEGDQYKNISLYRSSSPIYKFKALLRDKRLCITFLQDSLKLMVVDLLDQGSIQDHNL